MNNMFRLGALLGLSNR